MLINKITKGVFRPLLKVGLSRYKPSVKVFNESPKLIFNNKKWYSSSNNNSQGKKPFKAMETVSDFIICYLIQFHYKSFKISPLLIHTPYLRKQSSSSLRTLAPVEKWNSISNTLPTTSATGMRS